MNCYSWKQMEFKTAVEKKGTNIAVLGVTTTSGEYIEFSKDRPAGIDGAIIKGRDINKREWVFIIWWQVEYIHFQEFSLVSTLILTATFIAGLLVGL